MNFIHARLNFVSHGVQRTKIEIFSAEKLTVCIPDGKGITSHSAHISWESFHARVDKEFLTLGFLGDALRSILYLRKKKNVSVYNLAQTDAGRFDPSVYINCGYLLNCGAWCMLYYYLLLLRYFCLCV